MTGTGVNLEALRTLQRLIGRLNAGPDLATTLRAVVDGVVEGLGFGVAAVSLVHDDGTVEVVSVAGPPEVGEALLGNRSRLAAWQTVIARSEPWGALRFESHELAADELLPSWVPDIPVRDDADAWHPEDALYAPLHSVSGELVGILSVDLPADGRRPGAMQRELLEMYAVQAGIAIDNARLAERLRASEESFRIAFANAPVGMSIVDFTPATAGRFLRVNEAMSRMLGFSQRELETLSVADITHPDDKARDAEVIGSIIRGRHERLQFDKRYLHADGHPVWVSVNLSVYRDSTGTALWGITQFEDIGDRRAEHQELTRRACLDPLTGLLNRSELAGRVEAAIVTAAANGRCGAVLFCDLDGFKPVNDTHGHAVGDEVLAIVAKRMQGQVRGRDTAARFGGDEFVVVADDLDGAALDDLVQRLSDAVAAPMHVDGLTISLSVTVGQVAITGDGAETPESLLNAADLDMYLRKRRAREGRTTPG